MPFRCPLSPSRAKGLSYSSFCLAYLSFSLSLSSCSAASGGSGVTGLNWQALWPRGFSCLHRSPHFKPMNQVGPRDPLLRGFCSFLQGFCSFCGVYKGYPLFFGKCPYLGIFFRGVLKPIVVTLNPTPIGAGGGVVRKQMETLNPKP